MLRDCVISRVDECCIEMLRPRCRHVEARAACATGIWVDMQRWQHLEDGGDGSLGGEMGLNMSLTRRMWCSRSIVVPRGRAGH